MWNMFMNYNILRVDVAGYEALYLLSEEAWVCFNQFGNIIFFMVKNLIILMNTSLFMQPQSTWKIT